MMWVAFDPKKVAKAMAEKAYDILQEGLVQEAIEMYKQSYLYDPTPHTKKALEFASMNGKEAAEIHRMKGNDLFSQENYAGAVKEYSAGLKRDSRSTPLYSVRCSAYIRLNDLQKAFKDV